LPDGEPWIFKDYFTFEELEVNPAIVHVVGSKDLMVAEARMQRARKESAATAPTQKQRTAARFKRAPRLDDTANQSAAGSRRQGTR
jgi:hypothetical protein